MRSFYRHLLAILFCLAALSCTDPDSRHPGGSNHERLPPEAVATLELIRSNGPFPHRQDGSIFANREQRLPARPHGYYREYTVPTPGRRDRGARRIVAGGKPPQVYYYTEDHYRSFRPVHDMP